MNVSELPGIRKAAILLLTMDEELSKEVIKDLNEDDIEMIGQEISKLKGVPDDIVRLVHDEFMKRLNKKNIFISDGENKFKQLIKKSLGDEKADYLIDTMGAKEGLPGEFFRTCDPRLLANTLKGEHPQTIALVLSTLHAKKACDTIAALPEKIHTEVVVRMANLEKVDKRFVNEIESVIREQLENVGGFEGSQLGGVELVANIFNQMDKTLESELLSKMEEVNPELVDRIRQLMFTFEDLIHLDDRGVQTLLKEISSEELSVALKGASDGLKEKIFKNMSERAAAMLKEDLEAMGPVRLSDVERAQVKIAMTAKKLEGEGKLAISRGGEKFV